MHAPPLEEIFPAPHTTHVLVDVPSSADFPAGQLVQKAAPTAEILPTLQKSHVLVRDVADFPAVQLTQPTPTTEIFPTTHKMQSSTLVPAPAATEVPGAQLLQPVAPAAAPMAGALTHVPVAHFSHGAGSVASALNFPAPQLLQVLAFNATPPIDEVPAAHVVHGPVATDDVPAVLNSPTAHGLQVVVVVPVAAVPPVAVVALPVGQLRQAEDSVEWS